MAWLDQALTEVGLTADHAKPQQILLVDDTPTNLQVLMDTLKDQGHKLSAATSGGRALELAQKTVPDLVLLDVMMPEMDGYEVCRRLKAHPQLRNTIVVFCSALEDTKSKVRGFEVGGADFITKPYQPEEVVARVNTHLALSRVLQQLGERNAELERELQLAGELRAEALERANGPLLGTSVAIQTVRAAIAAAATTTKPLLISGGPSCGAEAAARTIHDSSPRRHRPFITVDCATLTTSGQSNLFQTREPEAGGEVTKLALAQGGTLFLDSVHLLPAESQQLLLVALREPSNDVRLIVAAPQSNEISTFPDTFDPWLVQELRRNTLRMPPLVERVEDLPELVSNYIILHSRRLGRPTPMVPAQVMADLKAYGWPGNLRELEDVVRRSVEVSPAGALKVDVRLLQHGIPLGSYRLVQKLGSGAMGEVWEANHQMLPRSAAVKLIKLDGADVNQSTSRWRRFEREARVTANLRSRNTVELYDFGVSEDGTFYYVMELLDGIDLDQAIREFGPMPPERVASLLIQVCCSLAEAHDAGLVHRDIKPANLFISQFGLEVDIVKVLDFGIVSEAIDADSTRLTSDNMLAGTPAYISPEAAMAADELTGKADIYSLGCVAYWLLTGRPIFEAPTTMALAMKHVMEPAPNPSDHSPNPIQQNLENVILQCLAKDPAVRPSAIDLWWDILDTGLPQQWDMDRATSWWQANL